MTPCIAEVYGALDEPFTNFMEQLAALAEYNDWCAWQCSCPAVQCKRRNRGLTVPAPTRSTDADDIKRYR